MYVLWAENQADLATKTALFDKHMEPMIVRLEAAFKAGVIPAYIPEIPQYIQVCRWAFRRLEYAFVLDALLGHLKPGDRFLDAGCGATPLAQAVAALGIDAEACDGDRSVILEQVANGVAVRMAVLYLLLGGSNS